ncbi:glutamate receptor ionotropic, kainate 2-like [Tubulanus polymorphus]|uniref:glutamate receptor ionotropic, kainate 2-like n=1 Tax=Tubulanus polymorphus TaxID=672921 RepID=UPI003DA56E78
MSKFTEVLCLVVLIRFTFAADIKIGGLFEKRFKLDKQVFQKAVELVNTKKIAQNSRRLVAEIVEVPDNDNSFIASGKACELFSKGIAAIIGPMYNGESARHVGSMCEVMNVPHLNVRLETEKTRHSYTVNLYPDSETLGAAFVDLVKYLKWRRFTIFHEDNHGLILLNSLFENKNDNASSKTWVRGHDGKRVTTRAIINKNEDYRKLLKEMKKLGETNFVVDFPNGDVHSFLLEALKLEMLTVYYNYIFTTLDIDTFDLSDFEDVGGKIRFYRMMKPPKSPAGNIDKGFPGNHTFSELLPSITTQAALINDAVQLFATAINSTDTLSVNPQSCTSPAPWPQGASLLKNLEKTQTRGMTGTVEFDNSFKRSRFSLELVDSKNQEIGSWTPEIGLVVKGDKIRIQPGQKSKPLIVTTILEAPFMMLKKSPGRKLVGNDRFEGFCVDLLKLMAADLHFNYTIKLVADGRYGAPVRNYGWNGMVRELMDQKADLAVAPLSISYDREQVIDFTKPFMNLGITILGKKPEKKDPSLFSFLSPFSNDVWALMLVSYVIVSLIIFVIGRFTPYEWQNPHPCDQNPDELENQFTFRNSFWFTIGSLMQQGSEIAPIANSTRVASGFWWFFTLIMISSYTANLAAFLTIEKLSSPINSAEDLSKQTEIRYGSIWGGSSHTFFKNSKNPIYERMWHFMRQFNRSESVMVGSTLEGVNRVKKGGYAFLIESTTNEYFRERNCDLVQIGSRLDSKGYGIGLRRGSPYRDLLSDSILKLQENEQITTLYHQWWREKGGAGACTDESEKDADELGMLNVAGVFVVLFAGTTVSIVVALAEFAWKERKNKKKDKESFCRRMLAELRRAARCCGPSTRPVKNSEYTITSGNDLESRT